MSPIVVSTPLPVKPEKAPLHPDVIPIPEGWFKSPKSLLYGRPDLLATEKLLLAALIDHARDKTVCWPSNATLMKACGFKFKESVTRLLAGLVAKGYLRIERVAQTPGNRTGRIIHLTIPPPVANGDGPRLHGGGTPSAGAGGGPQAQALGDPKRRRLPK